MGPLPDNLPWGLAVALLALTTLALWKLKPTGEAKRGLKAIRSALWRKVRKDRPRLHVVPTPQPEVDEGGVVQPSNGIEFGDPNNPGGGDTGGMG